MGIYSSYNDPLARCYQSWSNLKYSSIRALADNEKHKTLKQRSMDLFRRQNSHLTLTNSIPNLLLHSRNTSGPALFKVPKLKRSAKSVISKEQNENSPKSSNISAGMRRIFGNNFGSRPSTSGQNSSRPSTREHRSEDDSVMLPLFSKTHMSQCTKGINQNSDADSTGASLLSANTQDTIKTTAPRTLPSPPQPHVQVAHQAVPTSSTSTKVTTGEVARAEELLILDAFPRPPVWTPNRNRHAVVVPSSDGTAYAPSVVLTPPMNTSWDRADVATLKLKRPQTGAGSIPLGRDNSGSDLTSRNRPPSRGGSRPSSRSSSRAASRNSMRANSRTGMGTSSRVRPQEPAARVGPLTRTNGVPNLRYLESKYQQPPPKMGSLYEIEGPHLRRAVRTNGGGISKPSMAPNQMLGRKNSRIASRTIPTNAPQHLRHREGRRFPIDRADSTLNDRKPERPNPRTNGAVVHRNRGTTTPPQGYRRITSPTDEVQNEWLVRDIPVGNKVPPPHLMNSPGGRYPKPLSTMGGKNRQPTAREKDAQDEASYSENVKGTGGANSLKLMNVATENWVNYGKGE